MAIVGTKCRLCNQLIASNGRNSASDKMKNHLMNKHPKEYWAFADQSTKFKDEVSILHAKLSDEAGKLVEDPEYIMPTVKLSLL